MNKSTFTNLAAAALTVAGLFAPAYGDIILMTGLFALSGGLTNWLAVHMLFERIPLLYGSGVIPTRFEEFKGGIRTLIMSEFFTPEHVQRFLTDANLSPADVSSKLDLDRIFEGLVDVIEASSMGSMLAMVGGRKALEPLREPMAEKIQAIVAEVLSGGDDNGENSLAESLIERVEEILDARLAELTPEHVKTIIETMIRKHLGWLVVWGGVFGGLIGLVVSLVQAA
ncbi:MAG: DUF445 family protein [Chromatiales bacterium]|jgi:uncharacterized membrane protein YheB (UPF0754 family)|nr:DUF445 family protein [Chromatiales bacterium]